MIDFNFTAEEFSAICSAATVLREILLRQRGNRTDAENQLADAECPGYIQNVDKVYHKVTANFSPKGKIEHAKIAAETVEKLILLAKTGKLDVV